MRHQKFELLEYNNQQLMDELNEFMIDIKTHLFNLPIRRNKPSVQEIDILFQKLIRELKKDNQYIIKL